MKRKNIQLPCSFMFDIINVSSKLHIGSEAIKFCRYLVEDAPKSSEI